MYYLHFLFYIVSVSILKFLLKFIILTIHSSMKSIGKYIHSSLRSCLNSSRTGKFCLQKWNKKSIKDDSVLLQGTHYSPNGNRSLKLTDKSWPVTKVVVFFVQNILIRESPLCSLLCLVSSDPSTVRGRYSSQSSDILTESLAALFQSTEQ